MSEKGLTIEFNSEYLRKRIWQIIPGVLSWSTLIALVVLSFTLPFWIGIFIIAYDVYLLVRIVYMTIHLLYAYRRLREYEDINWLVRCKGVSGKIKEYAKTLERQMRDSSGKQLRQLRRHLREVRQLIDSGHSIYNWRKVHHAVVVPTYDESLIVLRTTLRALAATSHPKDRMHIVVGFEDRAGKPARQKAKKLTEEFGSEFGTFLTSFHPDGLPGETRVKSANATWAIQQLEKKLSKQGVSVEDIIVSNFDSDTVATPEYFTYLTYLFITQPDRYRLSYQPIPVYTNNLWDAPAFSRVIAMGSTFWQMIESTRPERLVTFSSHSMTLKALHDVGYWQRDIVSEDSRIFWQALIRYDGNYRTEPLYTTVSMDAALAPSWWKTLKNQYKQKRRWAWGIENFPFMVEGFWANKRIPWRTKATYLFRTLEGHYSWATAAIIVAGLGWLPVVFGGSDFHSTVLSYNLPFITRTLMTIAMSGLIISATLTLLLIPRRSEHQNPGEYLLLIVQWALVPVIATVLSAFPALDAETRLMLGRDLQFNVMQKTRKTKTV